MSAEKAETAAALTERELAEARRLKALQALEILDSPREEAYDRIVRLMRAIFGVDTAIISVIDAHRQWYKASEGIGQTEAALHETFCRHTIAQDGPLVVPDASLDPRFADNPYVKGDAGVRFYAGFPLKTKRGYSIGTLCAVDHEPRPFTDEEVQILEDLAAIVIDQMELRERAMTDELTGILTRRAFKEEGERLAALANRHKHNLTAICFDLDHFKKINDTYGHAVGDEVLRRVSEACRSHVRKSDVFGRLGGEEFAILLPETDRKGGLEVAEKLRRDISLLRFDVGDQTIGVTASLGVAAFDLSTKDLDMLLVRGDTALYQAKHEGRNRVMAWGSGDIQATSPRRRVLKAGKVSFNNGGSTIDCTVRSLGDAGAGMDLISTADVPNEFRLIIKSDGLDTSCKVTARTRTHIEVEFR